MASGDGDNIYLAYPSEHKYATYIWLSRTLVTTPMTVCCLPFREYTEDHP